MTLQSLYTFFATHKEGSWVMKQETARAVYNFVKSHDVKSVLELGTGIGAGTSIVAYALDEKGIKDFHIDTIEQTEKCYRLAQDLVPAEFKPSITFHRFDPIVWTNPEIPHRSFSIFSQLPEGTWDLIVVDGPGPFLENGKFIDLPNGDVQKMLVEDKIVPGTFVVFDKRIVSIGALEQYYSENFYILDNPNMKFNVIERKDNEVKFHDINKDDMVKLNYFREYGGKEGTETNKI